MSWFREENALSWLQRISVNVIKCGFIPQHIAVIMDGNRRFAKKIKAEKCEGHYRGFDKLTEVMEWCRQLGVRELTVYVFSIDNFKRDPKEVNAILTLVETKLNHFLENQAATLENQVCVRIIGNLQLLPSRMRSVCAKVMLMTKGFNKFFLNLALPYTSREEITTAVNIVTNCVHAGDLYTEDISEQLLSKCMYLNHSPDPNMIIRTSGDTRFSDFLLWQTQYSKIFFETVTWPELGFWRFIHLIFQYQKSCKKLEFTQNLKIEVKSRRIDTFVKNVDYSRMSLLKQFAVE